jgi:hypothetical protein
MGSRGQCEQNKAANNEGSGSISKLKEQNTEKGNEVEIERDLDYPSDENINCHTLLQATLMTETHTPSAAATESSPWHASLPQPGYWKVNKKKKKNGKLSP